VTANSRWLDYRPTHTLSVVGVGRAFRGGGVAIFGSYLKPSFAAPTIRTLADAIHMASHACRPVALCIGTSRRYIRLALLANPNPNPTNPNPNPKPYPYKTSHMAYTNFAWNPKHVALFLGGVPWKLDIQQKIQFPTPV